MARRDARVTTYIQRCAPFARPILKSLRARIHAGGAGLEETLKWRMPTFMYHDKIVCGIAGFTAHCALWFRHGKAVLGGSARNDGMGHFGRIRTTKDVPSAAKLKTYLKKAMRRIDAQHARKARSAR